tara:strand:- start:229 stop:417 length:189 start_codon:yes stop_codon:yes gene_type:complete
MPVYTVERRDYYIMDKEIEADTLKDAFEKLEKDDYFLSSKKGWCGSDFFIEDEEGNRVSRLR